MLDLAGCSTLVFCAIIVCGVFRCCLCSLRFGSRRLFSWRALVAAEVLQQRARSLTLNTALTCLNRWDGTAKDLHLRYPETYANEAPFKSSALVFAVANELEELIESEILDKKLQVLLLFLKLI